MSLKHLPEDYLLKLLPQGLQDLDARGLIRSFCSGVQGRVEDLRSYVDKFERLLDPYGGPDSLLNVVAVTLSVGNGKTSIRTIGVSSTTPARQNYANDTDYELALLEWCKLAIGAEYEIRDWLITVTGSEADMQAVCLATHTPVNELTATFSHKTQERTTAKAISAFQSYLAGSGLEPSLIARLTYSAVPEITGEMLHAALASDDLKRVDANTLHYLAETIGATLYKTGTTDSAQVLAEQQRVLAGYFERLKLKGTSVSFELLGRLLNFGDVKVSPLWGRVSPRIPNDVGNAANDPDFSRTPDYLPTQEISASYDPLDLTDGPFYSWESPSLSTDRLAANYYEQGVNGFNPFFKIIVSSVGTVQHAGWPSTYPQSFVLTGGAPHKKAELVVVPQNGTITAEMKFQAIAEGDSFNGLTIVSPSAGSLKISDAQLSSIKYRTSYYNLALAADLDRWVNTYGDTMVKKCTALSPADGGDPDLCPDGTAVPPYRPWAGDTPRHQAGPLTGERQLDLDKLQQLGTQVTQYLDEVRAATRFPRSVLFGFSISDSAIYAAFPSRTELFVTDGVTLSQSGTATGYPLPPYSAVFVLEIPTPSGVQTILCVGEKDPITPAKVNYLAPNFAGSYDFSTSAYLFAFTSALPGTKVVARWEPTSTELIRPEPDSIQKASGSLVGYQARAEDQFDGATLAAVDEYPWRRGIVAQGETEDTDSYTTTVPDLALTPAETVLSVDDQSGCEYSVLGYDLQVASPIRIALSPKVYNSTKYTPSKRAYAVKDNQLYHVGSASGVLVADLNSFYTPTHADSLVCWLPLNQHPEGSITAQDASAYHASTLLSTSAASRVWNDERGWVQRLDSTGSVQSCARRGLTSDFCLSMWLNPGSDSGTSSTTILQLGSTRVMSGSLVKDTPYRVYGGSVSYDGNIYTSGQGFIASEVSTFTASASAVVLTATADSDAYSAVPVIWAELTNTGTPTLTWKAKRNSSGTAVTVTIGAVTLQQDTFNFVWLTRLGTSFSFGVDTLDSVGSSSAVIRSIADFGVADNYLSISGASRSCLFHDFRLWNSQKTPEDIREKIRVYPFKESNLPGKLSVFATLGLGEYWSFEVLPNGWVVPAPAFETEIPHSKIISNTSIFTTTVLTPPVLPSSVRLTYNGVSTSDDGAGVIIASPSSVNSGSIDYATGTLSFVIFDSGNKPAYVSHSTLTADIDRSKLSVATRYDSRGKYTGDPRWSAQGFGAGVPHSTFKLGSQCVEITASGTKTVASTSAAFGVNAFETKGSIKVRPPYTEAGGVVSTITPTETTWPTQQLANPARERIWLKTELGNFELTLRDTGSVELVATQNFTRRTSRELSLVIPTGTYGDRNELIRSDEIADTSTEICDGVNALGVQETEGSAFDNTVYSVDTSLIQETPTLPGYYGDIKVAFNGPEGVVAGTRVALTVNTGYELKGIPEGTYYGEALSSPALSGTKFEVVVRFAGLVGFNLPNKGFTSDLSNANVSKAAYEVIATSGTQKRTPQYLYLTNRQVYAASGTTVYQNWDDPTPLALTPTYATIDTAGLLGFTNNGSLNAGVYRLSIDAGNIGKVDAAFTGFEVEVTIGDTTVNSILVPGGKGKNPRATTDVVLSLENAISAPWPLAIEWTNDKDMPGQDTNRQLAIYGYELELKVNELYRVEASASGPVLTKEALTAGPSQPGGWLAIYNSNGSYSRWSHESSVRPSLTQYDGDSGYVAELTDSAVLHASTVEQTEDIILSGAPIVVSDPSTPAAPSIASVTATPSTTTLGTTVAFTVDASGTELAYAWEWWDGSLDVTSEAYVEKVANRTGTLNFTVRITDLLGRSAFSTASISVS